MNLMRTIHRWVGLILGLQLFLWMLSGLVMGLLPHELVSGEHHHRPSQDTGVLSASSHFPEWTEFDWSSRHEGAIVSLSLQLFEGREVYRIVTGNKTFLFDALTGQLVNIDESTARRRAVADYSGPGEIIEVQRLGEPTLAVRRHTGPSWRVDFNDSESTSLYISAEDGEVLERRNTYWRVFDFFWMLHIMDYQERTNFNNTLVIIAALILLWMGISGIVIWWSSFRPRDFAVITKWRSRH